MGNLTGAMICVAFFLPLVFGILFIFINKKHLQLFRTILTVCISLCGLFFMFNGKMDLDTGLTFFNEPITFSFSSTSLVIFILVLVLLWIALVRDAPSSTQGQQRFQGILLSLSLSFGFIAFFTGQFMIRYIALEIVGLVVALAAFESFNDRKAFSRFGGVFLILRLGDIGLWSSILILQNHAGTLNISAMINAATELPPRISAWVFAGFIFAILIKTAAYPPGIWLNFIKLRKGASVYWIPSILMPALGFYLLYRIVPIIQSQAIFGQVLALTALIVSLGLILVDRFHRPIMDRHLLLLSLTTWMAIYISAYTDPSALAPYLWAALVLRAIPIIEAHIKTKWIRVGSTFFLLLANAGYAYLYLREQPRIVLIGWAILSVLTISWYWLVHPQRSKWTADRPTEGDEKPPWQVPAGEIQEDRLLDQIASTFHQMISRFSALFEVRLLNQSFHFFGTLVIKTARGIQTGFEKRLNRLWEKSCSLVVTSSDFLLNNIENSFEKLWVGSGKQIVKMSETTLSELEDGRSKKINAFILKMMGRLDQQEDRSQFKSFRWDLLWIPLLLLVILFLLLIS